MKFCRNRFLFVAALLLSNSFINNASAAAPVDILLRVHWLGLNQISADTNAARFMKVWQLPQTTALLAQTFYKCSRWLGGGGVTNAASGLLRPLLDDLVSSESYLEIAATNRSSATAHPSVAFAIRLSAQRARLWQTNLPSAANRVSLSQSGEWTLVGIGADSADLLESFATRIPRHTPPAATNYWLEADLAFDYLPAFVPQPVSFAIHHSSLSYIHLTVTGQAGEVVTRGTLDFSHPLDLTLPSWEIPTNLIHEPLAAFTAVRGLAKWLAGLSAWQQLQFTPPPDQAFLWAQWGMPFQTYFAFPLSAASNQLSQLANRLVQNANPWLAVNAMGSFQWQTDLTALVWKDTLIVSPILQPVVLNQRDYLIGGLFTLLPGKAIPLSAEILRPILDHTNLVYYQTELTGRLVEDDLAMSQLFRLIFHQAQLPPQAVATQCLHTIAPLLGGCTTVITQASPQQLVLTRKSTIGITALELQLLADWLESPQFPHGLHTFLAQPDQ